jgi:hypothetical protein
MTQWVSDDVARVPRWNGSAGPQTFQQKTGQQKTSTKGRTT